MNDRREPPSHDLDLMHPQAGGGQGRSKGPPHSATRTPDGQPNRCPICGYKLCIEPSLLTGDAPCPRCGHLLWFGRRRTRSSRQPKPVFHIVLRKLLAALVFLTPALGLIAGAAAGYWMEALGLGLLWLLAADRMVPPLLRWLRLGQPVNRWERRS